MESVAIEVRPLHWRLARHSAHLGAIASAGDWSLPAFRQTVVPLLVAALRRIDGLPAPHHAVAGSGAAWLLARALQALRAAGPRTTVAVDGRAGWQRIVLGSSLVAGCALIHVRWQARTPEGQPLGCGADALAHEVSRRGLRCYRALARTERVVPSSDFTASTMLWLLRDLSAPALQALAADGTGDLSELLALTRAQCADMPVAEDLERGAMEALIRQGCWQVNRRKGRLWWLDHRLYLAWRTGARELASRCATAGVAPRSPDCLLRSLGARRITRGPVMNVSTPWTTALEVVELADPVHWLALAACAGEARASRAEPVLAHGQPQEPRCSSPARD